MVTGHLATMLLVEPLWQVMATLVRRRGMVLGGIQKF